MPDIESARNAILKRIMEGSGKTPLSERRAALTSQPAFEAWAKYLLSRGYR
jgi:hypothetical protein